MHRLATVRGTVNGSLPASFVVDTGGEVISISGATADLMSTAESVPPDSAEGLRHVRMGQGRVPDAVRGSGVQLDPLRAAFRSSS